MQVDLGLNAHLLQRQFPNFPAADERAEVTVHAGQMLYMPAGWFHEVTSYSSAAKETHVAVNYWFHPPDNLAPRSTGKSFPYTCDYWPALWNERLAHHDWGAGLRVAERGYADGHPTSGADAAGGARKRRKKR